MPRSRNIKHSFFTNDELSDIEPLGRLLFIGMWTICNHRGEFEWREKKIKACLLPYDNCDIKKIAINLDKSGFIRFYSDGDKIYVKVVNFLKHQNPHKNERDKGSDIPEFSEDSRQLIDLTRVTINRDKSGENRDDSASDPADSCFLIPDSCSLNPETRSLIPEVLAPEPKPPARKKKDPAPSTIVWESYSHSYMQRYGIEPVRNAKVNGQLGQFIQRVPKDEAPMIAAFYVTHNNSFYVQNGHAIGLMLRDAEKIRTEWARGQQITATHARQEDQKQSNMTAVQSAIAKDKARRNGNG